MTYDRVFSNILGVPGAILDDIKRRYSTDDQCNLAVVEYYLHYVPGASWNHLAGVLYYSGKEGALQQVQRYVQRPAGMTLLLITCTCIPIYYQSQNTKFSQWLFYGLQNSAHVFSWRSYTCMYSSGALLGSTLAPHLHARTGGLGLNMCSEVKCILKWGWAYF